MEYLAIVWVIGFIVLVIIAGQLKAQNVAHKRWIESERQRFRAMINTILGEMSEKSFSDLQSSLIELRKISMKNMQNIDILLLGCNIKFEPFGDQQNVRI
jgi:hypothetical protein